MSSLCSLRLDDCYSAERRLPFCQLARAREFDAATLAVVRQHAAGAVWARDAAVRRRHGRADMVGC